MKKSHLTLTEPLKGEPCFKSVGRVMPPEGINPCSQRELWFRHLKNPSCWRWVIKEPKIDSRDFYFITWQLKKTSCFHVWTRECRKGVRRWILPAGGGFCRNWPFFSDSIVSNSLWPQRLQPPRLRCSWDFPGKNTGVGCHCLLQGIFPTQGSNPSLLHLQHWQAYSLPLSHLGNSFSTATANNYWYLLCTMHNYLTGITKINSGISLVVQGLRLHTSTVRRRSQKRINSHNNPVSLMLSFSWPSSYKWEKWGLERSDNLKSHI